MARLIFILLLLVGGTLIMALLADRRGKQDARAARLRSSFLHGTPLGGYTQPLEMREASVGGLFRFRVPKRWREGVDPAGGSTFETGGPASPVLRIRVLALERTDRPGAPAPALADVLRGLRPGAESTVEELPGGRVLLKCLEVPADRKGEQVVYEWHLGAPASPPGLCIAQFSLVLPVAAAAELIVQSDVSLLERELREATLIAGAGAVAG